MLSLDQAYASSAVLLSLHYSWHSYADSLCGSLCCGAAQVELVVDDMRRSLTRRAGVDRRLPQFVGMTGFQDYAINVVVLVSMA